MGSSDPWAAVARSDPQVRRATPGVSGYESLRRALTTVSMNGNQTTTLNVACPAGRSHHGGIRFQRQRASAHAGRVVPSAADTWRVMMKLSQAGRGNVPGPAYAVCASRGTSAKLSGGRYLPSVNN